MLEPLAPLLRSVVTPVRSHVSRLHAEREAALVPVIQPTDLIKQVLARIIHEEADYSRKTNAPVWYKGCAHRPFATTEALA